MKLKTSLENTDRVLLVKMGSKKDTTLLDFNSGIPTEAASLIKVYFAALLKEKLEKGEIKNMEILITKSLLANYGTDILTDLVKRKNSVKLDILTLIGLMLKYSCNSSAKTLTTKFLPQFLKGDKKISLQKLAHLFKEIYSSGSEYATFIQEALKTSRNIYYLFDQQEIEILGSKSGTISIGNFYSVGNAGLVKINGEMFFIGAIVKRKRISQAVKILRKIGREVLSLIK